MDHSYVFSAIRGVQAGRQYYVTMCPLRIIPKIFLYDEEELGPEFRAQRVLNHGRVPEIAEYILESSDYCFSALTASIDGDVEFTPYQDNDSLGALHVAMDSRFIINDGQHRRAAIQLALEKDSRLGSETIAVVFFHDRGLERSQQMFADLNRNAVRPSASIGVLYDHRDKVAKLTRELVFTSDFLNSLVEFERTTLAQRSRKLFTLSALHAANLELVDGVTFTDYGDSSKIVIGFWEAVAKQIPEWGLVHQSRMTSGEVRMDFLHSHSLILQALGRVGNTLLANSETQWDVLSGLAGIDWSRRNADWEGRAISAGKVVNSRQSLMLTSNYLKRHLGLSLSHSEQETEDKFCRSRG